MRNQQTFALSLFFLLSLPLSSMGTANNDLIDSCVAAIGSIRSYDVTYHSGLFDFPDLKDLKKPENLPVVWSISTNRDVFAVGMGRRFEQYVGDNNRNMGVLDLRTANPGEATLNTYETYSYYINPVVDASNGRLLSDCFFLTDLLTNQNSTISPIEVSSFDSKLIGFQVNNSKLRGQYIRVWLDPEHGYLLGKMEWYRQIESWHTTNGPIALTERMQVEEFTQVDGKVWVPVGGSDVVITPVGQYKGRAMGGGKMEVDLEHSSWNSVKSDELFLPKSLPEVNYEKDGWKYDYSPARLSAAKSMDAAMEAARNVGHHKLTIGIVFLVVGVFTPLFIIILVARKRKKLL